MNIVLWILQVLLGLAFLGVGYNHAFRVEQIMADGPPQMRWVGDLPRNLLYFIGTCEILGAIGLVLPAATDILPDLTPLAAVGLAMIMLLAMAFHYRRKEYQAIALTTVLGMLALFIAYGRWELEPF